ncbi:MAG: efflux RND transporter periplasmic adaptor subunit [Calditrichaceae bacterium]
MKKKIFVGLVVLAIAIIVYLIINSSIGTGNTTEFQTGEIKRGDVENTISSSGTLSPVTTVEVGTQVSGTIAKVYADFNDKVRKGQLLAVLDTVLLKSAVLDAEANLEKAEAQFEEAQANYERNLPLHEKNLISEAEFLPYRINLKTQSANIKSAKASMQRAERNLKYAVIQSPISGMVIQRNVEEGQTVASSFSTPTLFVIAEDLSQMEILAEVDESDIGLIKEGQPVRFDVQSYPEKIFTGTVNQVRLQPTVVSNVVTYTVVVEAGNKENLLLPGMTATVDFIIEKKENALLVPNSALRFQPDDKLLAGFRESRQKIMESLPDSVKQKRRAMGSGFGGGRRSGVSKDSFKQVWYLDDGKLSMEPIETGISDGTNTEIIKSRTLTEGRAVIIGTVVPGSGQNSSANSSQTTIRPGGPPPF